MDADLVEHRIVVAETAERCRHDDRPGTRAAVSDLECHSSAIGQRHRVAGLRSCLGNRTRVRPEQGGLVASSTARVLRVAADGVSHVLLSGAGRALDEAAEGASQPGKAGREKRRAATVHTGGFDGLTGQLGEDRGQVPLQRMVGIGVVRNVPAVDDAGGQHRGMLARAVHGQRHGCPVVAFPGCALDLVDRPVGWGLQCGLGHPGRGQDRADAFEVEGLARVAGAGQRQQPAP